MYHHCPFILAIAAYSPNFLRRCIFLCLLLRLDNTELALLTDYATSDCGCPRLRAKL